MADEPEISGTGGGAPSADIQVSAPADAQPAPAEPQPAPAESPPSETPAEPAPGEETPPKQSPGNARLQKRFSELTRTIYQERAAREAAEKRASELEARGRQAPAPGADEAPKLENFKDYEEYAEAKGRFIARQEFARASTAAQAQQQREQAVTMASEIRARWDTSESEFRGKVEDYDDVMSDASVAFSDGVNISLLDSDMGPQLAYYLKKHPAEAAALSQLSPVAAARAIGKLEVKLSGSPPAQAQPTRVPPPPTPVKAAAPADEINDQMPIGEYIKRRNKQELDRKRNG